MADDIQNKAGHSERLSIALTEMSQYFEIQRNYANKQELCAMICTILYSVLQRKSQFDTHTTRKCRSVSARSTPSSNCMSESIYRNKAVSSNEKRGT